MSFTLRPFASAALLLSMAGLCAGTLLAAEQTEPSEASAVRARPLVLGVVETAEPSFDDNTVRPVLKAMQSAAPGTQIDVVRLSSATFEVAVAQLKPDLVISPAADFLRIVDSIGAHPIGTRKTKYAKHPSKSAGGAVIALASRTDIQKLTVVNGRSGPYCRWWFITGQGGILINKNGARFITEREGICHVTPKLAGNPDGCHYVLADQATWERTLKKIKLSALVGLPSWSEERVLAEFKKQENLWKCDTLEELSKESGVSLEGLKKQIEIWNKAVETKVDNQFGRTDQEWQIGAGPYYMIRMFPWNNLSCGGVRVTEEFQVLGWDMKPVNGFYAAGETVAGVHGAFYCGGNACGFAHTSGFMAGKYVTGFKETKEA